MPLRRLNISAPVLPALCRRAKKPSMLINVTKPFLPVHRAIHGISRQHLLVSMADQHGPLMRQLETQLKHYLKLDRLRYRSNGMMAPQLARGLNLSGEIITHAFFHSRRCPTGMAKYSAAPI